MRHIRPISWTVPAVLLAAACSGEPERATSALSDDLQRDLALAQSSSLELAGTPNRTQVASAIEIARPGEALEGEREATPTPRRQRTPERAPTRQPTPDPVGDAPTATEATLVAAPAGAPEAEVAVAEASPEPAEAEAGAEEPEVLSGPRAVADGAGTARPRDPGGFGGDEGDFGGTGVVIRGGGVGDDDHCQYHPRGGGPISVGGWPMGGMPIGGPMYGGRTPTRRPAVGGGNIGGRTQPSAGGGRTRPSTIGGSTIRSRGNIGGSSIGRAAGSGSTSGRAVGGSTRRARGM